MKKLLIFLVALMCISTVYAAEYENGFETDVNGWNDYAGGVIARVASGNNGIASADGSFHAEVDGPVYTQWGGYNSVFPSCGYTTQVDIFLDMDLAKTDDKRFDFSSAVTRIDGTHLRDYIFHVGTVPGEEGQFAISASNNAPGWPMNPARDPAIVDESGWYTFKHVFKDVAGVLEVDLEVYKKSDGSHVGTWTLSNEGDLIGTVAGGNRYGWFTSQRFDFDYLAIDNTMRTDCTGQEEVPEFGTLGVLVALAGAGMFVYRKRQ